MAGEELPVLRTERLLLRPALEHDASTIARILVEPEVRRWWGANDIDDVRNQLRVTPAFAIEAGGAVAGWLQVHEEADPDCPSVAFDIALTEGCQGRGFGGEALRAAIGHFARRGHHRFTIDPAVSHERAISCYAGVGFRPVGVMRAYERTEDGSWRDDLLMDLLAEELP